MADADAPEASRPPIQAVMSPLTPFQQDCSLLCCTEAMRGTVTDSGGDPELIESAIAERAVTVEKVLITHGHLDHTGSTKDLARRLAVSVEGPHEADMFWIGRMEERSRMFGFAGAMEFEPNHWLKDGDTVNSGNVTMDVIHCPGHTSGHVVFVHRGAGFPWSGTCCSRARSADPIS